MKARCSRQAAGDWRRRTEKTIANDGSSHVSCFFSVDIQIMLLFAPIAMCAMLFVVAHRTAFLPFFVHYAQYCIQFSIIQAFSFVWYTETFFRIDMIVEKKWLKKSSIKLLWATTRSFLRSQAHTGKLMKLGQNIKIYKYFVVSKKISSFPFLLVKYYSINSPYKIPTVLTMQVIINSKTRSLIVSKRQWSRPLVLQLFNG